MDWLNKYADIWVNMVYEYVKTSFELLRKPKRAFRDLCENTEGRLISPSLYFVTNILIMQIVVFVSSKVANKTSLSSIVPSSGMFVLPVLGEVGASYIFGLIGFHIGAAIVLLTLTKLIKNSTKYFDRIKNAVMYSSVITMALGVLDFAIVLVALVLSFLMFYFFTDIDFSYLENIRESSMLDDIYKIEDFVPMLFGINVFNVVLSSIVYFGYMLMLVSTYLSMEFVEKVKAAFCVLLFSIMTGAPTTLDFLGLNEEVEKVRWHLNKILDSQIREVYEDANHGYLFQGVYYTKMVDREFLGLSQNRFLSDRDKLRMYKIYFLIINEKNIPEEEKTEPFLLIHKDLLVPIANDKYINYLLANSRYSVGTQRLVDLNNMSKIEENMHNKSSVEMFLYKYYQSRHSEYAWLYVFSSLFRIIP